MAWRIEDHIVRGEIDNRVRDRITGRIWFVGRDEPIELDLTGNAWRDVAGRCLEFLNPSPVAGKVPIVTRQVGVIGNCSASVKMKIPEIPFEEARQRMKDGQPFPWHWGNCLYLEWFSQTNGRVVIQSHDYKLTLTPEATWEMSEEEHVVQRELNAEALQDFMRALADLRRARGDVFEDPYRDDEAGDEEGEGEEGEDGDAAEGVETDGDEDAAEVEFDEEADDDEFDADDDEDAEDEEGWESERPLSEEEAEEMQQESDRLADRIQARLDREGPNADFGKILQEELERRRKERGEKPLTPEEEAERAAWVDEMNRAAKEAMEHRDPDEAEEEYEHPAAQQAFELSTRLHHEVEASGWVPKEAGAEHPLVDLVSSVSCAGAKMAGALNGETWPPEVDECASKIVRLKRARSFFEDAASALNACDEQQLADAAWRAEIRGELDTLTRTTDELIAELRARLERGFD